MATPEEAKKLALMEFISALGDFAKKQDAFVPAEISALVGQFGVNLSPEQIEGICANEPSGPKMQAPATSWEAPPEDHIAPPPEGPSYTLGALEGLPIRYSKEGVASKDYGNCYTALKACTEAQSDKIAFMVEKPGAPADGPGEMITFTWQEYFDKSVAFAKALIAVGHQPGDAVAVCGFNHPAWFFSHFGAIFAGGMSAGTYITNSAEACHYVAEDSGSVVACVDTVGNLKKYLAIKDRLPKVKHVAMWLDAIPEELKELHGDYILTFDEFLALGDNVAEEDFQARTDALQANNCCSLIYTSGTTGNPKAVMVSHDSVLYSAACVSEMMQSKTKEWHIVSYLPMSHIAAQMLEMFIPLHVANHDDCAVTVHFARPDALKGTLGLTLKIARPTFFFGVPRVWEKFVEGIKAKAKADPATGVRKLVTNFGIRCGALGTKARQVGGDGELPYGYAIAKQAVHAKVREALGLDRCENCYTGAAPIQRESLEFLGAMGIDVMEVYGMSETSGMGTMCRNSTFKFGSCGFRTTTMELKVEHVEGRDAPGEGEICFRGRHVMMGYLHNEEKTSEVIDAEGWMHSGDVGRIDEDGACYITGRIKELIIGAGGENIAPVPIEYAIKLLLPALSNVVVIGDKRKFNTLIVTLKSRPNLDTGDFYDDLIAEAAEVNPEVTTVTEALNDPKWQEYIQQGLDEYNKHKAFNNASKVHKFTILPKDLSIPGGELTGTLKLKRNVLAEKYADVIDAMYGEKPTGAQKAAETEIPEKAEEEIPEQSYDLTGHPEFDWTIRGNNLQGEETVEVEEQQYDKKGCYLEALKADATYAFAWIGLSVSLNGDETVEVNEVQYAKKACLLEAIKNSTCDQAWEHLAGQLSADETIEIDETSYSKKQCLLQALSHESKRPTTWHALGFELALDESVEVNEETFSKLSCYGKALEFDKEYAPSWAGIAAVLEDDGIFDEKFSKKDCLVNAITYAPADGFSWFTLGRLTKEGEAVEINATSYDKVAILTEALKLNTANTNTWDDLADVLPSEQTVTIDDKEYCKTALYVQSLNLNAEQGTVWFNVSSQLSADENDSHKGTVEVNGTSYNKLSCLVEALKYNPDCCEAWTNVVSILGAQDTLTVGENSYTKKDCCLQVLSRNDTNGAVWAKLAHMLEAGETVKIGPEPAAAQEEEETKPEEEHKDEEEKPEVGPILSDDEIAIIRSTWAPVAEDLPGAGKLFYETMFEDNPTLPETDFKGVDMDKQALKLMKFVDTGVSLLEQPADLVPALTACGERHSGYGTAPESYPVVGANLIKVLKIALGDAMTPEAEAAWKKLYDIMADTMIAGQNNEKGQEIKRQYDEAKKTAPKVYSKSECFAAALSYIDCESAWAALGYCLGAEETVDIAGSTVGKLDCFTELVKRYPHSHYGWAGLARSLPHKGHTTINHHQYSKRACYIKALKRSGPEFEFAVKGLCGTIRKGEKVVVEGNTYIITGKVEPILTDDEIAIIRSTWAPVAEDLPGAGTLFYETMFEDNPTLPETDFKGVDMDKQALKLMKFVDVGVSLLHEPVDLVPALTACGERHSGYGTAPESYPVVGANLIKVLKIALGDAMTEEAEAAWKKLYDVMADAMIAGQNNEKGQEIKKQYDEAKAAEEAARKAAEEEAARQAAEEEEAARKAAEEEEAARKAAEEEEAAKKAEEEEAAKKAAEEEPAPAEE